MKPAASSVLTDDPSRTAGDPIREMFSRLAPEYDRFNRWSSLGLDGVWRRVVARTLGPGQTVLDLGAGTGALAGAVARQGSARVVGVDFSLEMLARARGRRPALGWAQARAERLPFPPGVFDAVVSAFVMRNLRKAGVLDESLAECFRVLRPGGRLLLLDLTRPASAFLRWGHALYVRTAVTAVGLALFGGRWPGAYLRNTIEDLPPAAAIGGSFGRAGFADFRARPLVGGAAGLFEGTKRI